MKLTTIEVKGRKFEVFVNENNGQFETHSTMDFDSVKAASLDELKTEIAKRITRSGVKLNIPFVRFHEGTGKIRRGVVTGIHAANKNLLITWDDGTKEQEYGYASSVFIDPKYAAGYENLAIALHQAKVLLRDFVNDHSFNAKDEVKKQLSPDEEKTA